MLFPRVLWLLCCLAECFSAPLPNLDKRHSASPEQPLARQSTRKGEEIEVTFDRVTGSPRVIRSRTGYLDDGEDQQIHALAKTVPSEVVGKFIRAHTNLFGHGPELLDELAVKRDYNTEHNALRTVEWQQSFEGVPVFEGLMTAQLSGQGRLVSLSSRLLRNVRAAAERGNPGFAAHLKAPKISVAQAIEIAATNLGASAKSKDLFATKSRDAKKQTFRGLGIKGEARASLVWLPMDRDTARLCWEIDLRANARAETYRVLVDALSGVVMIRRSMTAYLTDATYRVFVSDSPTPFSPGYSTPTSTQPDMVDRRKLVISALSTNASPGGWIDDGGNETLGNNVDAHTDWDDDDLPDLPRPHGFPRRIFDFPLDLEAPPRSYANASVVQLFYWSNWMHDRLYDLGFTEAAGNFQSLNFGRGGEENDAVQADAQDGGGFNNANFTTLEDGVPGRMQMYLFDGPKPNRDGALDAEVVLHEYTHGLTTRLVGGGGALNAPQSGGMGEGWSDFYAITLLSEAADDPNGAVAAGAYASYQLEGEQENYYFGIRRYPYSTDLRKNPLTLKDIDPTQASPHSGIPMNPIFGGSSPADEVHDQGEVWCSTLWEARAALIQKYGYSEGTHQILQLVTDALRLTPAEPTFLEARDAIIQADLVNNQGANKEILWRAFAKRGMGFGAQVPPSDTTVGVIESFDVPDDLLVTPIGGFVSSGPAGGPFVPFSGAFTLKNVSTNRVSWTVVNSSVWLELSDSSGEISPGGEEQELSFKLAAIATSLPAGVYNESLTFSNKISGRTQTRPLTLRIGQPDYFTREFASASERAAFQNASVTFTPDSSPSGYRACYESASAFPVDPSGATQLGFGDDTFLKADFEEGRVFPFFGQTYTNVFIGGNGYLTFGRGVIDFFGVLQTHFSLPRISAYSSDLDPTFGGQITQLQLPDRFVVTFDKVPGFFDPRENSFQVELFFDGTIRLTWLETAIEFGVVGLSSGNGVPVGFAPTVFEDLGACIPVLTLSTPVALSETDGTIVGTISIPSVLETNVTVHVESESPKVTLATNITLAAGVTSASFRAVIQRNPALEGTRLVRIVASADGFKDGAAETDVHDAESATISVNAPSTAREGDPNQGLVGSVQIDRTTPEPIIIRLVSSDTNRLSVPLFCLVPPNALSASFPIIVRDDKRITGNEPITLTATVQNWISGNATINWEDNEQRLLRLTLPKAVGENAGVLTGAGKVTTSGILVQPLTVSLRTDRPSLISIPPTVTIPAGESNAVFDLSVGRDTIATGPLSIQVTAEAPEFTSTSAAVTFNDDQTPPAPFSPQPADRSTNNPARVTLSWAVGSGQVLRNGHFETGQLGPWRTESTGDGRFTINDGTVDPDGPSEPVPPRSGKFDVVSQESSPGRTTLSQIVAIPPGVLNARLRWKDRIFNYAASFDDFLQTFRVEIQSPGGDVLGTVFRTKEDDPTISDWTAREVDLSDYIGSDIRIVFVQDVTLAFLNVYLDDIELELQSAPFTSYAVYFGTTSVPGAAELKGRTANNFFELPPLELDRTYYWQIVTEGSQNSTRSPVWSFTVPAAGSIDHFAWVREPSAVFTRRERLAEIEARDQFDNIATNFTDHVKISGHANLPTETIGIGSEVWDLPLGGFFPVVRVQSIYLASEIGGPRMLTGIALNVKDPPGELTRWTMRLKHTTLSGYPEENASLERAGWTTVVQRNLAIADSGWFFILFTTPFEFNGTNNLVMDFSFSNSNFGANGTVRAHKAETFRSVSTVDFSGDPLTLSGSEFTYSEDLIAQIRLFSEMPISVAPALVANFTNGVWSGTLTVDGVGEHLQLGAEDTKGHSGASSEFSAFRENDLRVTAIAAPLQTVEKERTTYTVLVSNNGPLPATGVIFSNVITGPAAITSASTTQGTINTNAQLITAWIGTIAPWNEVTLQFDLVANVLGTLTNKVIVARSESDSDTNHNALEIRTIVEPQPSISVADATVTEGSGQNLVFDLELSKASSQDVTVDYVAVPGSASLEDFEPAQGTITFRAGTRQAQIEVKVRDDSLDEEDETLKLRLANPSHATLENDSAIGTILDDEGPDITVADVSIVEGSGTAATPLKFVVQLSTNTVQPVTVDWETLPLTAGSTDFEIQNGTITFAPGTTEQTITIDVTADSQVEPDERFVLSLTSAVGGRITRAKAFGTILNDDGLPGDLDHFRLTEIPSPQFVDEEFPVTVTALDRFDQVATNFNSSVDLSALVEQLPTEIGTHEDRLNAPLDTSYYDLREQIIYLAKEVGSARELTGLGLYVTEIPAKTLSRFTIRLRHTSLSSYPGTPRWESTGWTTVYQGDQKLATTGLVVFAFSQPFTYDGRRNLMVDFSFHNDDYDFNYGEVLASSVPQGRSIIGQSDGEDGDPLTWAGTAPFTFPDTTLPDIQLLSALKLPISTNQAGPFINGAWQGTIAIEGPAEGAILNSRDTQQHAGNSARFDVILRNDLAIAVLPSIEPVTVNGQVSYQIMITNTGPVLSSNLLITNDIPAGATLLANSSQIGTFTSDTAHVIWNVPQLAGGSNVQAAIILQVPDVVGAISGTTTVSRAESELYLSNNSAAWRTRVLSQPTISVRATTALESSPFMEVPVVLSNPSSFPVSVDYFCFDAKATSQDYAAVSGHLVFPPGTTNQVVRIALIDDDKDEADEDFSVIISNAENATIAKGEATCTIEDDDGPELFVTAEPVLEGDSGTRKLHVIFSLGAKSVQSVSFNVATVDDTARAEDNDYTPFEGPLTFAAGETNKAIDIDIIGDLKTEGDEFFWLEVSGLKNASTKAQRTKAVILNDDGRAGELNSFLFDLLPATIFSGQGQYLSILARDGYHNRATGFSGTATLSAEQALDDVNIGTNTTVWEYPIGSYEPSRLQTIYLTNELKSAFTIDALSLDLTDVLAFLPNTLAGFSIRLKPTTRTSFTSNSNWETNDWVTVFSSTSVSVADNGWMKFQFTTPFYYDGTNNLMVDFINRPAGGFSGSWESFASSASGNRSIGAQDAAFLQPDPSTWAGRRPTPTTYRRIPNILLSGSSPIEVRSPSELRFDRGLWEGKVELAGTAAAARFRVHDSVGHNGSSDTFQLATLVDSDGDGLPDAWEKLLNLDAANATDATLDSDGDGVTNIQEFESGTRANDPQDALRIYSVEADAGKVTITILVVPGRSYVIERTDTLGLPWSEFARISQAETDLYAVTDSANTPATRAFYRVRLQR